MKALVTARRVKAGHEEEFRRRWAGGSAPTGMLGAYLFEEEEDPRETLSISLWENARDLLGYRTSEEARERKEKLADIVDKDRWHRSFVAWTEADMPARGFRWWLAAAPVALALLGTGVALMKRRGSNGHKDEWDTWDQDQTHTAQEKAGAPASKMSTLHGGTAPTVAPSRRGMLVRDIMTANPRTIETNTDAAEASRIMRELNVGVLPVMAEGSLAGMITDRDLALALGERKTSAEKVRAGDVMSSLPVTIQPSATVEQAAKLMAEHQIRRLPVVDGKQLVGILSLGDLAADGAERAAGAALEEISEPAAPQR
jgi:CBS domain-containing protein/heme-degrading monooxygenase HmoA